MHFARTRRGTPFSPGRRCQVATMTAPNAKLRAFDWSLILSSSSLRTRPECCSLFYLSGFDRFCGKISAAWFIKFVSDAWEKSFSFAPVDEKRFIKISFLAEVEVQWGLSLSGVKKRKKFLIFGAIRWSALFCNRAVVVCWLVALQEHSESTSQPKITARCFESQRNAGLNPFQRARNSHPAAHCPPHLTSFVNCTFTL